MVTKSKCAGQSIDVGSCTTGLPNSYVQVVLLVFQVAGAFVGAGAFGARVPVGSGAAADAGRDLAGLAVQDLAGQVSDPFLGGRLALVIEGPGGLPQVFNSLN